MDELLIKIYSVSISVWRNPEVWDSYLSDLEMLIPDTLAKLDENDPIRRKADVRKGEGNYITDFAPRESAREILGIFSKSKVTFNARVSAQLDGWGNRFNLYLPGGWVDSVTPEQIMHIFSSSCRNLDAFYAICDSTSLINGQKPSTPGKPLNYSTELSGVNWLTYFGDAYVDFFGKEKFDRQIDQFDGSGGVTIRLAEGFSDVSDEMRRRREEQLGALTFSSFGSNKTDGEHAMLYPEILRRQNALRS